MNRRSFFGGLAGAFGLVLGLFGLRREEERTCLVTNLEMGVSEEVPSRLVSMIRWIPVEERLPENRRSVLIADREGCVDLAYRDGALSGWRLLEHPGWVDVTHWAELPKGPA